MANTYSENIAARWALLNQYLFIIRYCLRGTELMVFHVVEPGAVHHCEGRSFTVAPIINVMMIFIEFETGR